MQSVANALQLLPLCPHLPPHSLLFSFFLVKIMIVTMIITRGYKDVIYPLQKYLFTILGKILPQSLQDCE